MKCPTCHKDYSSGKFCPECGCALEESIVAEWCPKCQREHLTGKFCPECGSPLVPKPSFSNVEPFRRPQKQEDDLFKKASNLEFGIETSPDMETAAQLYLQAAEQGNADSMCHIGYLMLFGYGIKRQTHNAIYWLESGLSHTTNASSIFCQNARKVLDCLKAAPYPFVHEDARWPAFQDQLVEYNKLACKNGFKALTLENSTLQGTAVDGFSLYFNDDDKKRHYLNFAKLYPDNGRQNKLSFWDKTKQDFALGQIGQQFKLILPEMLALGID